MRIVGRAHGVAGHGSALLGTMWILVEESVHGCHAPEQEAA